MRASEESLLRFRLLLDRDSRSWGALPGARGRKPGT